MKTQEIIGGILFSIGVLLVIFAFQMDVTVAVDYSGGNTYGFPDRVNNLGLMADRQNYMVFGAIMIIGGLIMIYTSPKQKTQDSDLIDCPKCAEKIKKNAVFCKHCKNDIIKVINNDFLEPKPKDLKKDLIDYLYLAIAIIVIGFILYFANRSR